MKLTVEIIKKVNAAIQLRKDGMPEGAQAVLDSIKSTLSEEQWAIVEMMLAGAAPAAVAAAAPPAAKDPAAPDAEKPEEAMAKAKKAADEQAALVAKALAERLNQSAPDALTKIAKSHPEVAAVLEQLAKRADAAEADAKATKEKLEKAEKSTAEEIQKGRLLRFQKIAETDLKYLQGKPEEIAKRLCDLEDVLTPDEFKAHVQMLKAASAQIAKAGTFKPQGAPGTDTEGDAYQALVAKARELMKTDPKLTQVKAMVKVSKDPTNVEIVKRYQQELVGAN